MSPIRGLTDRVMPAFSRIGKIRKGGEAVRNQAGQVVKMGPDLQFFRFTSDRPEVQTAFDEAYGKEPTLVNVYLPYAKVEDNFQCWKEAWSQGGLQHRCDGVTCTIWLDADGKYKQTPKACPGGCDEVGRLVVIIPELVRLGHVGYVTLETHGIHDLLSIQGSLMAAAEARASNELGLRGIPWVLRRQPEKISTPAGNGKRARREKWLVKIEPAADWVQLQLESARTVQMAALPAPQSEPKIIVVHGETGEVLKPTAVEVLPPEPPVEGYTSGEQAEDAEVEGELPPDAPTESDAEYAARWTQAEADLKAESDRQGRTWANVQGHFAGKVNKAFADLTIPELEAALVSLKASVVRRPGAGEQKSGAA